MTTETELSAFAVSVLLGKKEAVISYHSVENQDCYPVMSSCKMNLNSSNTVLVVLTLVELVELFVCIIKYTFFNSSKLSRELAMILFPLTKLNSNCGDIY